MRKLLFAILTFVVVFGMLGIALLCAIPSTALNLPLTAKLTVSNVFPQGWGFFTKNPLDEAIDLQPVGNKSNNVYWPMLNSHDFSGFNRYGRTEGIEIGSISSLIPKNKWQKGPQKNRGKHLYLSIKNPSRTKFLHGKYKLSYQEIIPWAYANEYSNKHIMKKYVYLNILK